MRKNNLPQFVGGLIGFVVGIFGGGYIGLVLGGTFLGGFNIYERTGFEGYELATYVGSIIGAIIFTIVGINIANKIINKKK